MIKLNIRKKLRLAEGEQVLALDTEFTSGSLTALYGPSGAGKTTILNIIAGLLKPEEGIIEVNGQTWLNTQRKIDLPPQKRNVGFVFQDYALFPNMTVRQNLQFSAPAQPAADTIQNMLALMELETLANVKPGMLSGGQQQRVALARAIIRQPQLLLLDEPLSALGHEMRVHLRKQLYELHQQYQFTTLLVSHDAAEVYQLANRVLHINEGKVVADGAPQQLLSNAHETQLQLVAEVITVSAEVIEVLANHQILKLPVSAFVTQPLQAGQRVTLLCNSADLSIQKLS